jgi:hypothetical protein
MHLPFSFVVRSSLLMKRCTPGGGRGDCNKGDKCDDNSDCAPHLYCNTILGLCENQDRL